jgi:hypothetical protein
MAEYGIVRPGVRQQEDSMKKAVVALAFGVPAELRSNKCVAEVASKASIRLGNVPIFTQLNMQMHHGLPIEKIADEHPGHWANTMQMARAAVAWAHAEGIEELWLAAATPHVPRTLRDFHYVVRETKAPIKLFVCPEHRAYKRSDWFNAESEQQRTRSIVAWLMWDIPLTYIMPMAWYRTLTDKPL